jgi:hypothetical protein
MFSTTFRPNGAQIKIRKGACPRDHDMRSPQSCSPDLVEDQAATGELGIDGKEPTAGRGVQPAIGGHTRGCRCGRPSRVRLGWRTAGAPSWLSSGEGCRTQRERDSSSRDGAIGSARRRMAIGKPRPVAALRHNWVTSPTAFCRSITGQRNGISDRGCWRYENRRLAQGATLTVRAIAF